MGSFTSQSLYSAHHNENIYVYFSLVFASAGNIMDLITDESKGGSITEIEFDGCDQDDYDECPARRGETVNGRLKFSSTGSASTLTCQLYGIILGVEVPFPGGCPVVEACNDVSVGDCPIEAGEIFDYKMTMKIESFFPAGSVLGKWTLQSPDDKEFVSFKIPILIE